MVITALVAVVALLGRMVLSLLNGNNDGSIAIHTINVTPAQVIPYKVGAGGASDAGSGQIIIEY
jgi:hypothetical protein